MGFPDRDALCKSRRRLLKHAITSRDSGVKIRSNNAVGNTSYPWFQRTTSCMTGPILGKSRHFVTQALAGECASGIKLDTLEDAKHLNNWKLSSENRSNREHLLRI